jgi:hypothetical protein
MTWWQLLGACGVSFLSTVLAALVSWRRGYEAGHERGFSGAAVGRVTRQLVDELHDNGYLLASIAKDGRGRT